MGPPGVGGLEVRVLGPTELTVDGAVVRLDRHLERALAVRLALARGAGVTYDVLARDIWGEGQVDQPAQRLRVLVYRLRQSLGEHAHVVRRPATGYALDAAPADLVAVEEAMRLRSSDATAAALEHWRGPALADLRDTPFGAAEGTRLDAVHLDLRTRWFEAELARGASVGVELDQLVTANPLDERLVGLSAIALYRVGRQADALGRLARLRESLAEQLGVDPSPETTDLEVRLLRQDAALFPRATATTVARELPALRWPTATFVGRDTEKASLLDQLRQPSTVTLTGGPGVGKTRLAQEVAAASQEHGRPVAWLDLAPVTSTEALLPALSTAVSVDAGPGDPLPPCVEALSGALLVIDNAEHLVDAVAALLTAIHRRPVDMSILVTSQRALRITAEHVYQVGPLGHDAAITLFRSRSGLEPDDRIGAICAAVDRLPLAIELAAGLTRTLSLAQLAGRIEHQLRLLIGGNRDAGNRHSSLRAAIDWSYSLLDPPARQVLHRLAVFTGGCTLEAAEHVTAGDGIELADVPAVLAELHDRCLLAVDTRSGAPRFSLLQAVRDHALEQLRTSGEQTVVRRRHATWCAELASRTEKYGGPDHTELLGELTNEEANLRSAIEWALGADGEPAMVMDIAAPTWWYWWSRGLMLDGQDWLRRALAATASGPTAERAAALRATASLTRNSGEFAEARLLGEEALAIHRALGDDNAVMSSLVGLCITNITLGDFETALRQATDAGERARAADNRRLLGAALNAAGGALRCLGRAAEATAKFNEAVETWRSIDDRRGLAGTLSNLGMVAKQTGDLPRSRELCLQALRLYRELDLVEGLLDVLEMIAGLEAAEGRPATALRLLEVSAARRLRIGAPLIVPDELAARNDVEAAVRGAGVEALIEGHTVESLTDELLSGPVVNA